jgi:enoyl-CoA hydratase/carnithine racemase
MHYQGAIDMHRAAQVMRDDPETRLILIRGAGRAFCSGLDLKQLAAGNIPVHYFELWDQALRLLEQSDKIVLCALHGYALGGGLQLALACDIRISTEDCQLGLPAIKEGIAPGLATFRLPRYIGLGRAKSLVLSGASIDGLQALAIGLVDHVYPAERFEQQLNSLVASYLEVCSEGTRQSKHLLNQAFNLDYDSFFTEYLQRQAIALASPDHEEAKRAYREGRIPRFSS